MSSRSKRSRGESLAPALFPFLAVLVCTMGALVLILVIVVSQASASAKVSIQAEEDALLEVSDMVEVNSEELKAQRAKQQEIVNNRRSQLAAIEDHISRLMKDLKNLNQTADAIEHQSTRTEQQRAEQSLRMTDLEHKLRDEETLLEEIRSNADKARPAFAILPYQGNRGTTRRPIYLECTQRGVIIQPEGVLISIEDLKPPHGPGNPLDASLRLIRSSYQRLDPTASSSVSPYPLLLVRPDGIKAYVLARAAMSSWDDQFGYELIDQAMPLAFPATIPGMAKQLNENLGIAQQRQIALIAAMPRRYSSENELDEALDSFDQDKDFSNSNSPQRNRLSSGTDWSTIDKEIAVSNDSTPWKMIAELPTTAGGQFGSNVNTLPKVHAASGSPKSSPGAATTLAPSNQDRQRMQQASLRGSLESAGALTSNSGMRSIDEWQDPSSGESIGSDSSLVNQSTSNVASTPSGSNLASSSKGASQYPTPQSSQSGQTSFSNSQTPQSNSLNLSSQMNPSNQDINQAIPPASESNSVNVSPSIDLSPRRSNQRSSNDKNASNQAPVRTWTSSHKATNGTMVSRPITIVAMPDRWLIIKDTGQYQIDSVIPLSIGPSAAGQKLEQAIEARVESWGVAVAQGYWKPKLTIEVGPAAEKSSQRLQKLLIGSGLDTTLQPLR